MGSASFADTTLFGPKLYFWTIAPSDTYTNTFHVAAAGSAKVIIRNGSYTGIAWIDYIYRIGGTDNSANVYLNGAQIFGPSDFSKNVYYLEKTVQVNQGTNTLQVELRSVPLNFITVQLVGATITPVPSITMSAQPESIAAGRSSVLSWTSTNATSCTIDQGIGEVSVNGTITVTPTVTTTYTITATGAGGVKTSSAIVTVINPDNPPYVTISAVPSEINAGGYAQLSWSSSGGQKAFIDNGIGLVALSGTVTVNPAVTTMYKITISGSS